MKIWIAALIYFFIAVTLCQDFSPLNRIEANNHCLPNRDNTWGNGMVMDSLPLCDDEAFVAEVQRVLDSYIYTEDYKENVFDCTQCSQICWLILKQNGFEPRLLYCNEYVTGASVPGSPFATGHVWVVVPKNKYEGGDFKNWAIFESGGWVPVETTAYSEHGMTHFLGVAQSTRHFSPKYQTTQGIMFNTSTEYDCHISEGYDVMKDPHPAVEKYVIEV